jgi:hypothetical protein
VSCVKREPFAPFFFGLTRQITVAWFVRGNQPREIEMKLKTGLFLSTAMLFNVSFATYALADEAEAVRLEKLFQGYLSDTKGVVVVKGDGDGYAVKIDTSPLLGKAGADVKLTPVEFKLANQGDGKWQLVQDQSFEMSVDAKDQGVLVEKIGSIKLNGIFDEKLSSFTKINAQADNIVVSQKMNDPSSGLGNIDATIKSMAFEQTGTAGANGSVDIVAKYTLEGLSETINTAGKPETGVPPMNLVINAANGTYEATGKGLNAKPLFDIIAFFVAHQTKELISKDQTTLKAALKDGLPLFENIAANGRFDNVKVDSQFGQVGMESLDINVDMNGITKDGKLREKIGFNGLTLPPTVVPPWATKLVPKNMSFDFTISGFDLASPAQKILDQLDLAKEPPLPDGFEQVLMPIFMPKGVVDITLNPSSVDNDTYGIKMEGSLAAGPAAQPSGKAKISAKGIDELMKIIQSAPPEADLDQGNALVIVAKGMAKAEPDGSLTWNIEASPDGKVLVNGIDPTKLK